MLMGEKRYFETNFVELILSIQIETFDKQIFHRLSVNSGTKQILELFAAEKRRFEGEGNIFVN
jgi:hypothetical protein